MHESRRRNCLLNLWEEVGVKRGSVLERDFLPLAWLFKIPGLFWAAWLEESIYQAESKGTFEMQSLKWMFKIHALLTHCLIVLLHDFTITAGLLFSFNSINPTLLWLSRGTCWSLCSRAWGPRGGGGWGKPAGRGPWEAPGKNRVPERHLLTWCIFWDCCQAGDI